MRGFDPPHFDPHLTGGGFRTHATLSFFYSTLLRHRLGPAVPPGTFTVEPHLAERWDMPNETTDIFHLRQGMKWHNKPPLNGRELVAEVLQRVFSSDQVSFSTCRLTLLDEEERCDGSNME